MRPCPTALRCAVAVISSLLLSSTLPARAGGAEESAPRAERRLRFNGRALTKEQRARLESVERFVGRIVDGDYWYDSKTGASGRWGGPTLAFLPPGLELGGPLPADASGGGAGQVTGVFVNGRELHPLDVAGLRQILARSGPAAGGSTRRATTAWRGSPRWAT
jgi:hypothetical protein